VHWSDVFTVFVVSHLVGDYLLQTDWQARNKLGGLRRGANRRALLSHVATYTACFIPAFVWLAGHHGGWTAGIAALVAIPHLVQDDGWFVAGYMRAVKRADSAPGELLYMAVDQTFHVVALFAVALLVAT
jgi:hypothetical protein